MNEVNLLTQLFDVKIPPDTNHFNVNPNKAQNRILLRKFLKFVYAFYEE
jgi:hypothetical protein